MEALDHLRRVSPEVVAAAVIGLDGAIEGTSTQGDMEDLLGPTVTMLTTIAARTAQELGRGALNATVLEGAYGRIVTRELGDGRTLVVVSEPEARLGLLLDDVRACGDALSRGGGHV